MILSCNGLREIMKIAGEKCSSALFAMALRGDTLCRVQKAPSNAITTTMQVAQGECNGLVSLTLAPFFPIDFILVAIAHSHMHYVQVARWRDRRLQSSIHQKNMHLGFLRW